MDHENSQQTREFLRTYVNGNREPITDWLNGSGNAEEVGSHLLCIMLERLAIDEKPDLNGIAGGYIINLFQSVPVGIWPQGVLWRIVWKLDYKSPLNSCHFVQSFSVSSQCLTLLETLATNEDQKIETGAAMR